MPSLKFHPLVGIVGLTLSFCVAHADIAADNSRMNQRDRSAAEVTADNQSSNKQDVEITRQIRRRIIQDKAMSIYAQNIKIISSNGLVTLKGPLKNDRELHKILIEAKRVAGTANVINELEIVVRK